jgi:transcriptional regulator with XRE-family HTH domain
MLMTIKEGANLMKTRSAVSLTIPVKRALHKLGGDIRDARRRRRIPMALLAERALLSRTTLTRVEKGDPGASVGAYATVLFVLGMTDRLADLADPRHDSVGLALEEERLPQRIRIPRAGKPKAAE